MECIFPKWNILFGAEARATIFMSAEIPMAVFQFSSLHCWNSSTGAQNAAQIYNNVKSVDENLSLP